MSLATIGAVVGGVGSAAGSIGSLFGPKGGGEASFPTSTNPGLTQLQYLFGKKGKKPHKGDIFGTELKKFLQTQLSSPTTFPGTTTPFLQSVLGTPDQLMAALGTPDQFANRIGTFNNQFQGAVDTARQLNETGLPTDGSAYFDEAIRNLTQRAIPNAAEVSGLGVQSSGFANASAQASQDLLGQAALANIDLQEAAINRRLQSSPLLASLLTSQQAIPEQLIGNRLGLTNNLYNLFNTETNRPLSLFQSLYNMGNATGQYIQPGYNPSDSGAGYGAALGGLSGILNSLSNFNFGTGGSDTGAHQEFLNSLYTMGGPGY